MVLIAMVIGRPRPSNVNQGHELPLDAPNEAGCERAYTDYSAGTPETRPRAVAGGGALRQRAVLVVQVLSRVVRDLGLRIPFVTEPEKRGTEPHLIKEGIETNTAAMKGPGSLKGTRQARSSGIG